MKNQANFEDIILQLQIHSYDREDVAMAIIREVRPENELVTSLFIDGEIDPSFMQRRAGQFLSIQTFDGEVWSKPHPFTISNAPEDDFLQMTIKNVGAFTSTIRGLKPGTEVRCRGPFGSFCSGIESESKTVMVAGGIGITPFLSVLRHFIRVGNPGELTLLWANNREQDLFAQDELLAMTETLNLKLIHVIMEECAGLKTGTRCFYERGYIAPEIFERNQLPVDASFYLCGSPAMQEFVLKQLAAYGVDSENVAKESFHKNP